MAITERQISIRAYSDSDEPSIRLASEEQYYGKFSEFSKADIQIIMLGERIVGWFYCFVPDNSIYHGQIFIFVFPEYRRKGIGALVYHRAVKRFLSVGCGWWTSYPASQSADLFVGALGFGRLSTNIYLEHDGRIYPCCENGIRMCRADDYPAALDIWTREYAAMHARIGMSVSERKLSDAERREEYNDFLNNIRNSFVLERDGALIGFGSLFGDNSGIGALAVDGRYVGEGCGTRLAAFLTNECIRRGCSVPCLYCESENKNALHIYRKIGYREVSRETTAMKFG